jgi:hypothetical protein
VVEFLIKENILAAGIVNELHHVCEYVCMGVSSNWCWVQHSKDGSTDIADISCSALPGTDSMECIEQKVMHSSEMTRE